MEATKKTSMTKTALLVVAALSMLLSGLFIATASRSDASPPPACPDGFSLTADAKNCFQAAVVTSADNPNSCDAGQLTPDGTKCYVAARVIPQAGSTECPKGYSPDDSLGGMCARFENASINDDACPSGARGTVGACYILVAKGPRGVNTCDEGTLAGNQCVIQGADPTTSGEKCVTSSSVFEDENGDCFQLLPRPTVSVNCDPASANYNAAPYTMADGKCSAAVLASLGLTVGVSLIPADTVLCPSADLNGATAGGAVAGTHVPLDFNGTPKIGVCSLAGSVAGDCTGDDTIESETRCRRTVALSGGTLGCAAAFGLVDGDCIRYEAPVVAASQCPQGSIEDGVGDCRKPVADAAGAPYCKDANAALNGKSCVFTSGFLANDGAVLYKCDTGSRAVIGAGASRQVICILGDANANLQSGPSCLQGVLSTDNAYCIVPRIDTAPAAAVAAPVPSFTG